MLCRLPVVAGFVLVAGLATAGNAQVVQRPSRDRTQVPQTGTGAIKGRVVDGQTGTALPRARIRLLGAGIQRPGILTSESGTFAFTDLPRGAYTVSADKPTYLTGRYPETGQTIRSGFRPLPLSDGQVIDGITVSLFHGSAITGHVVDAHGDPFEQTEVRVLKLPKSGSGRPQQRGGGSTNDIGEFRIARLEPGRYLLLVVPRRFGPDENVGDAQPVPTYYPGVLSIEQAQPIAVERGTSITGLELMVADGSTSVVSGTVVDATGQPASGGASINARTLNLQGGLDVGSVNSTAVKPDGTFQLKLPPGDYELDAQAVRRGGVAMGPGPRDDQQFGSARVSVAGDVSNVTIVLGSGAKISGRIVFEGTNPPPPFPTNQGQLRLMLMSMAGAPCRMGRSEVTQDWTFTVDGASGTCVPRFTGGVPLWTLKAIVHDGKDLLDHPITFEPGQQLKDVEIVLTDKRTDLTLHVADEQGTATQEYVVLLFPVDKTRWTDNSRFIRTYVPPPEQLMGLVPNMATGTMRMTVTTSGGPISSTESSVFGAVPAPPSGASTAVPGGSTGHTYTMSAVPPGDYYAVALDDIEGELVHDADTLEQLSRSATQVTLSEGLSAEISLRRIKFSDVSRGR